jgi:hypothetical protein
MKSSMKIRIPVSMARAALSLALLIASSIVLTQAIGAQAPTRFMGTITAISGDTLTVKTDAGELRPVEVPGTAAIKRIAPGQHDLSSAETLAFAGLAAGDRVLVKLDPSASAGAAIALQIIAIKQEDVAQKQQKEREDWQRRGVGGLVKSVDPAAGVIVLTSGAGATAKTVTVRTAKTTMLKRYAPASVSFEAAQPAPVEAIHPGDQLRARGAKNADGSELAAEEVISGTFRNIAGTIISLDSAASTLVVKDLATKKTVTIHITAQAQMRKLPERMAQMLAMRLKGGSATTGQQGGSGQWAGQGAGQGSGQGGDPQQFLSRAPAVQLTELKKGDAVMLVATEGSSEVTAITLLAGVEPLLEAPAASQNLLANWSMGGGDSSGQ